MRIERLVYMANQIGKFFAAQGEDAAIAGIADHMRKYWDPRMRSQILAHVDANGVGLDRNVHRAVERLRSTAEA